MNLKWECDNKYNPTWFLYHEETGEMIGKVISNTRKGTFIAFHGSWNRAPLPQEGYYVVFVPFKNGKPSGPWEVFANGFSGCFFSLAGRAVRAWTDFVHRSA